MINIFVDQGINKIIIKTDDPSVKCMFEFIRKETKYVPWVKQWRTVETITKLYDNKRLVPIDGIWTLELGLGWASYVANMFKDFISQDEYMDVIKSIMSDSYPTTPFPGLRDYQNSDVLHILKYKRALMQVNTGYGKTQVIATLTNYAYSLGKKVLIVTPGKKAQDEVVKRCKTLFNLDIPNKDLSLNRLITSGIINSKRYKDPEESKKFKELLATYDWLLVDEVEYTINDGGKYIFDNLTGCTNMYFFSATADKYSGKMVTFANGIDDTVLLNKDMVKYTGPALVYRLPQNLDIDFITIKTQALNNINFTDSDEKEDGNIFNVIMTKIWTDPEISKLVVKIAKRYPRLYIPINNLTTILNSWINDYWLGIFRILLVCGVGSGYIYYDLAGNKTELTLEEACDYIKNGLVDIIPSTSAGFRALDFPNLESALIISNNMAGQVLQAVGRIARSKHMNIITLDPMFPKKIPVFSKGTDKRDELMREFYKYCKTSSITINENNL